MPHPFSILVSPPTETHSKYYTVDDYFYYIFSFLINAYARNDKEENFCMRDKQIIFFTFPFLRLLHQRIFQEQNVSTDYYYYYRRFVLFVL